MTQPNNALVIPSHVTLQPNLLSMFSMQVLFAQLITAILSDNFTAQDRLDFCVLFASCRYFANNRAIYRTFMIVVQQAMGMRWTMSSAFINVMSIYNNYRDMDPTNRRISRVMALPSSNHTRTVLLRIVPGGVNNLNRRITAQPNSVVFRQIGRRMQILRTMLTQCLAVDGALDTLIVYGVFASRNNRADALIILLRLQNAYRQAPVVKWYLAVFDSQRANSLRHLLLTSIHMTDVTSFLPTDPRRLFNLRPMTGMHWTVDPYDVVNANRGTGNRGAYLYLRPS